MKSIQLTLICFFSIISLHAQSQGLDTLINTGTYQLHFKIKKGNDTVILFESGGGLNASQWDTITTALHHSLKATLISYDRAGFGKSGIDTTNYSIINEIKGLEFSLNKLGYANNSFILVSHSLGSFYSRVYASRHPKQIKGIIMLDPRIPSYTDMIFARKTFNMIDRKQVKPEDLSLYFVFFQMEKNSDFARQASIPRSVPVLDIMAEKGPFTSTADNNRFKSDQIRFVKEATNRSLMFAKGSSHNIVKDKPKLVIDQIASFYKKHP